MVSRPLIGEPYELEKPPLDLRDDNYYANGGIQPDSHV